MQKQALLPRLVAEQSGNTGLIDTKAFSEFRLRHSARKPSDLGSDFLAQLDGRLASNVLGNRDCFKVVGVHARSVSAQVVNRKPIWDWSPMLLIEAPCSTKGFTASRNVGVTVSNLPLPNPAGRLISTILNRVQRTILRASSAIVSTDKPNGLASDDALLGDRLTSKWGAFSAPALTQATGIWFGGRMILHFWSLLHRFRGVVPKGVIAPPRLYCGESIPRKGCA